MDFAFGVGDEVVIRSFEEMKRLFPDKVDGSMVNVGPGYLSSMAKFGGIITRIKAIDPWHKDWYVLDGTIPQNIGLEDWTWSTEMIERVIIPELPELDDEDLCLDALFAMEVI